MLKVKSAPRLYVPAKVADSLGDNLHSPFLEQTVERVLADADRLVKMKPIAEGEGKTYQQGTRTIDSQLGCLTAAWTLTRKPAYRAAALKHLGNLMTWNHISCEARFNTPPEREMPFCLSYGEHSATIGLMFDLFRRDMTDDEKQVFLDVLDRFYMKEALKCLKNPPWWAFKSWSNWNGVCAGGMGIMAMAFYTDHPGAPKLIPFVEKSLGEYFKSYIENGGGCHEGTGYWNYGMNYAMRYLLSWENSTGKKHPALKIKELATSLHFPLDFTGISFGDNDGWHPSCFFFLLADRLKQRDAALRAATYVMGPNKASLRKRPQSSAKRRKRLGRVANGEFLYAAHVIPTAKEMEKLRLAHEKKPTPVARVYDGMDWAALADDSAFPALRLAARGGSSKVAGHGMLDLLSIRCRVNNELIITDQADGGYMATTFTGRGTDLYGRSPASKSTLFVDGLGCASQVECESTEVVKGKDLLGIRIDGSRIYMPRWKNHFIGRLLLMVERSYWLIIDHVRSPNPAQGHWVESRYHTHCETKLGKNAVSLKGETQQVQMSFAALGGGKIQESRGMPSQPQVPQTTILRWMGTRATPDALLVTAVVPGTKRIGLKLNRTEKTHEIIVKGPGGDERSIRLKAGLKL